MSKFDKFKDILNMASPIAGAFLPGAAGSILSQVTGAINAHDQRPSPGSEAALRTIAADNDEQTKAILALMEYAKSLEARIVALETK